MYRFFIPCTYRPDKVGVGSLNRIYKNAAGDVLRIDEVTYEFSALPAMTPIIGGESTVTGRLLQNSREVSPKIFSLDTGASRVVAEIQMIGDFTSFTENSGSYLTATWLINATLGSITVNMADLPIIGTTV
jgi:hypothetical protein